MREAARVVWDVGQPFSDNSCTNSNIDKLSFDAGARGFFDIARDFSARGVVSEYLSA
jgi:hypothetical protein